VLPRPPLVLKVLTVSWGEHELVSTVDLTIGALQPAENTSVPTVTDNLFKSGAIPSNLVSVSFEPTTAKFVKNGELTFGGTDPTKFTGSITYA
jgi:cathepsin E